MFSKRTAWTRTPNELTKLLEERRASGAAMLDLTCSNPTRCGFTYEPDFYTSLTDATSATYVPESLGIAEAREAIAAYYTAGGQPVDAEQVWIAAGTSELYAHILSLLADPGASLLVPQPGYPLFDPIGDLVDVSRTPYELSYDGDWHISRGAVESAASDAEDPRALVAVSPGNPTGNYVKPDELAMLDAFCADNNMALIVDEVFADYPLRNGITPARVLTGRAQCLSFVLSGLSKVAALPQLKLAWAVVTGPDELVREAMARAEIIADTFLSPSTPVQLALPRIFAQAGRMQQRILERCRGNMERLRDHCLGSPVSVLNAEGGWTALLRLPTVGDLSDEVWARLFLEKADVYVQPGFLYDFMPERGPPIIALSLLTPTSVLSDGVERILDIVEQVAAST